MRSQRLFQDCLDWAAERLVWASAKMGGLEGEGGLGWKPGFGQVESGID